MISAGVSEEWYYIRGRWQYFSDSRFPACETGKGAAFVGTKLKNIINGGVVERPSVLLKKNSRRHVLIEKDMQYFIFRR